MAISRRLKGSTNKQRGVLMAIPVNTRLKWIPSTLAALLFMTGCTKQSSPDENMSDRTKHLGQWAASPGKCPTLEPSVKDYLGIKPESSPSASSDDAADVTTECVWSTNPGPLIIALTIFQDDAHGTGAEQKAAKQIKTQWEGYTRSQSLIQSQADSDFGDESYIGIHRDGKHVIFMYRSKNAVVKISRTVAPELTGTKHELEAHNALMRGFALEVTDDLVPYGTQPSQGG